jgi:hypothetical protein
VAKAVAPAARAKLVAAAHRTEVWVDYNVVCFPIPIPLPTKREGERERTEPLAEEQVMADITASMVKELRERTQAGMADCKNALVEAAGDMEKAVEVILKKGIVKAAARAGRVAAEGEVRTFVSTDAKYGVIVEVNCQTDFVARGDEFKGFVTKVTEVASTAKPGVQELCHPRRRCGQQGQGRDRPQHAAVPGFG